MWTKSLDLCTILPSPIHPHQNKVESMEQKGKHFVFSAKFEPLSFLCLCWSLVFGPYVSCIPIKNPHASLEDGFSTLSQAYHWTLTTCVSPNPMIKTSVFTGEADEIACQPLLRLKYLLSASGYPGVERAGLELQINTSTLFLLLSEIDELPPLQASPYWVFQSGYLPELSQWVYSCNLFGPVLCNSTRNRLQGKQFCTYVNPQTRKWLKTLLQCVFFLYR